VNHPIQLTRIPRLEFHRTIRELFDRRSKELLPAQLPLERLAGTLAESVTTGGLAIPDCVPCGACCGIAMVVNIPRGHSPGIGNVWEVELEDSPSNVVTSRVIGRDIATGNCSQLAGKIGERVGCECYECRPPVCREFDAGSDKCHEYRRMYGIEPQLAQAQVAELMEAVMNQVRPAKIIFTRIVRDSMGYEFSMHPGEEGQRPVKSEKLKIEAVLNDENYSEHELHIYDPLKETWFESDFLGLSLLEARELVSRQTSKV
jgi:hypothetical protein